jgi:peptide chain release factor 2
LAAYAKARFNFHDECPFALPNLWKIPYNPALNLVFKHSLIIMFEINPIKNKIADLTDRTSVLRGYL